MKALIRIAALTLLMLPAMVSAQEPANPMAGYWTGGPEQEDLLLDLRIQGDVVTGPISTRHIGDLYIRKGTVTANTIEFTSPSLDLANREIVLVWHGQLSGDGELALVITREDNLGEPREVVLKRRTP
jgi:hypothetical protein